MYSKHPRNNFIFDRKGMKRPGYNVSFVKIERAKENVTENDTQNRLHVVEEIEKGIREGKSMDEILDALCSDEEINKQFDYLKRNGLNLRTIFASWYESKQKNKNAKGNKFNTFIKD